MLSEQKERLRIIVEKSYGIRLYPYQLDFLHDCIVGKRVTARMCRQSGKSLTLAIYAIIFASTHPNTKTLIVAPTDTQCGLIFDKITHYTTKLNEKENIIESITLRKLILKNGAEIKAMTTGDEGLSIRGETAHLLILDESSRIKESIYNEVLFQTITGTAGKIIEISTPFGKSNHFYKHCMSDKWISHHVPWEIPVKAGHIQQSIIDEAKETITNMQFETEYSAEFVDDAANYFPLQLIQDAIADYPLITKASLV